MPALKAGAPLHAVVPPADSIFYKLTPATPSSSSSSSRQGQQEDPPQTDPPSLSGVAPRKTVASKSDDDTAGRLHDGSLFALDDVPGLRKALQARAVAAGVVDPQRNGAVVPQPVGRRKRHDARPRLAGAYHNAQLQWHRRRRCVPWRSMSCRLALQHDRRCEYRALRPAPPRSNGRTNPLCMPDWCMCS